MSELTYVNYLGEALPPPARVSISQSRANQRQQIFTRDGESLDSRLDRNRRLKWTVQQS